MADVLTSQWPHDETVPATTLGRSHHSTLSRGRSHDIRADETGTAAGERAVPASASVPQALAPDRSAARAVASHPEQGWSLLCNGVVLFDDGGELLPASSGATVTVTAA